MELTDTKRSTLQWTCTKCGKCCSDSNLEITLTHVDVLHLFLAAETLETLKKALAIHSVVTSNHYYEQIKLQMALPSILINNKESWICLKKRKNCCIFLNEKNLCNVYENRPLVCRTFPFCHSEATTDIKTEFTVRAKEICPGINTGKVFSGEELRKEGKRVSNLLNRFTFFVEQINTYQQNNMHLSLDEILNFALLYAEKEKKEAKQQEEQHD